MVMWWTVLISGEMARSPIREAAVELRDYFDVLRRRWMSFGLVLLVVLMGASAYALLAPARYTATTRLFFAVQGSGTVTDLAQGSTFAEKQMTSYAEVARSPIVLEPVISTLGLGMSTEELAQSVTAVVPTDTVILEVSATDADPSRASLIANAIGSRMADTVAGLSPDRSDGSDSVQATTLAPAQTPLAPSSPNVPRTLAVGLALGLLLGTGVALLRHVLDTKVRSESDVRGITDASILGVIAFDDEVPSHPVILREDPHGAAAEAIRRLRTNMQFIGVAGQSRTLVVSSSVPAEGKSTTAINLAVALADAGSRVLLVDADLRRPSIAGYLGLEGAVGLTTVLIGKAAFDDVVQPYANTSLDVLAAGQIPPNPSELLGSAAMRSLLDELSSQYDTVLIDTPPLLPVTDAAVLGRQVGGALVIAGMDRIHRPQLREALESLETAGCQVLGVVVNKVARREVGAYVYERGYYSSNASPATPVWEPSTTGDAPGSVRTGSAVDERPPARV